MATIFFSFIVCYWKAHINDFQCGQFGRKLLVTLVHSILRPLQLSILKLATCWLLKWSWKKQRLGLDVQHFFLLLEYKRILLMFICFDILMSFSIYCISSQWKVLFKFVFNIMVLKLYIYRSFIIQIVLVDMLSLYFILL